VSPLRRGAHEHVPGHVYHWRHGWIPLDYPTALHAAGDDHGRVTLAEHRAELLDPTSAARMRHARADYNE
jgi:hypothetical protein